MVTSMKNITQFLLMLTLSFYIAFAPAVAYADEVTDKIDKLQIDLQKRVGDRWTLSPKNSVGASVNISGSQSYPVTATTTATTAAGATTSNTATLTAEKIGSKIFTPTTANIAKRFGMGVAQGMVAMALYDLLMKSVDYVLDPANNQVIYKDDKVVYTNIYGFSGKKWTDLTSAKADLGSQCSTTLLTSQTQTIDTYKCFSCTNTATNSCYTGDLMENKGTPKTVSFDELAQRSKDIANNPSHKDVATAQSGMQTVVGDMITNNEIDNSYFNDADISNDTYNDVTNNYVTNITNQYPSVSVPSQAEMAQAAANGQSSVTKTTQNANGSTTTTTTNFNTTNNNTTNNNNTTTNNTYNITNITVNNPTAQKDDSPASTPASTPTPTASTPASTTTPTDSKPFELPAFCDWAKPVCDFIDWVKKDPEKPADDNTPFVKDDNEPGFNIDDYANKPYVQFSGQCPAPPVFNVFGGQIVFPMDIICKGCEQMSWVFVAFAWLRAVMIVFFASKG